MTGLEQWRHFAAEAKLPHTKQVELLLEFLESYRKFQLGEGRTLDQRLGTWAECCARDKAENNL